MMGIATWQANDLTFVFRFSIEVCLYAFVHVWGSSWLLSVWMLVS